MREMKFRQPVWNDGIVIGWNYWGFKDGLYQHPINQHESYEFTGLIGENDKEVYEGDILKDEYGRILLVERWKCGFSLKAITETNFIRANEITQWFEGDTPRPKVIGNIVENPEIVIHNQA